MPAKTISFNTELKDVRFKSSSKIKKLIKYIINNESFIQGFITIILTTDNKLLTLNQKYLAHDYYTDVITFDYSEGKNISGEIYISYERVLQNSVKYNTYFQAELNRVIIHGILHLCGYKDKTENQKELMRNLEDKYLKCST